ncbi:MAG: hypothetical protein AAFS12_11255 [Cyanobacteria bacterium J06632_19]
MDFYQVQAPFIKIAQVFEPLQFCLVLSCWNGKGGVIIIELLPVTQDYNAG